METKNVSALGKVWKLPSEQPIEAEFLAAAGGSEIVAKILKARGLLSVAQAEEFLQPEKYKATDPMELPDVDKAVARISKAIDEKEHITVYGDYDVDGVTGTSVLLSVLKKLGANVDFYIPNRSGEGYGLNLKAVSILASKHRTKLIITCDCGVSNFAEINFGKSLSVETLVLDHHSMPELLPPAVGIVHPKRLTEDHPLFHLPGVGVAYKVCEALLLSKGMPEEIEPLLDFVTLGMIADLVPLVRENRYLVKIGLTKLVESKRPGIKALLAQVRGGQDTDIVGFGLAPRINAVGRLSDAKAAVELMTTDDETRAEELAHQLQMENARRQELCEKIFMEADHMVSTTIDLTKDLAIAICKEGWHHGVVGIVASRLVDKYHRPVFIGEHDVSEGIVKGSARGVEGIDLYEVLKANEDLLLKWGGHKMAAGFSVEAEKAQVLLRSITDTCNKMLGGSLLKPTLPVDAIVQPQEVSMDLAQSLTALAPFGMNNRKPLMMMSAIKCASVKPLGKEGKHARIMLEDAATSNTFEVVMWSTRGNVPTEGEKVDVVFTPEINSFKGIDRLQLVLSDWRKVAPPRALRIVKEGEEEMPVVAPHVVEVAEEARPVAEPAGDPFRLTRALANSTKSPVGTGQSLPPSRKHQAQQEEGEEDEARPQFAEPPLAAAPVNAQESPESQGAPGAPAASRHLPEDPSAPVPIFRDSISEKNNPAPRPTALRPSSVKYAWKDLREHPKANDILTKAVEKLGRNVLIFSESAPKVPGILFSDRTSIVEKQHLLLWQFPPNVKLFQEIISRSAAQNIYLLGVDSAENEGTAGFLKRLFGVVRYAINKRDGQVHSDKLCAALGASKMSIALGLTILRKVNLVDWYSEEGMISLDLLGAPMASPEEFPEFKQLENSLADVMKFRQWCKTSSLKEIQCAVMPNHLDLGLNNATDTESQKVMESEHSDGQGEGIEDTRETAPISE